MRIIKLTTLTVLLITMISCASPVDSSNNPTDNNTNPYNIQSTHVSLGVPFDTDTTDDYLIVRSQYVLSYNKVLNIPNWVSWELNSDWFGDVDRYSGNFITDTTLPIGFYRVKHSDYTNSGYDRGHLVRSEERTKTIEDNKSTFILTNIIPQTPDLNRGVWLNLEYYCEDLCKKDNKLLYVIAGGINRTKNTIGNQIVVPDSCFKIVVVLEKGQSLLDVNESTQIISVVMPNIEGVRSDKWEKYRTSVRAIENSTGYNFLDKLPINIQNIIEQRVN